MPLRSMKVLSSSSCCCAAADSAPGAGCASFALRHAAIGSPPSSFPASERNSSCVAWNSRSAMVEQAIGVHRDAPRRAPASARRDRARAGTTRAPWARHLPRGTGCSSKSSATASVDASARSPSRCMSSSAENARGRSFSMKLSAPRNVSRPTLTKMPGGSLMLSRAACTRRAVCRSFDSTRRARSGSGACVNTTCAARLEQSVSE